MPFKYSQLILNHALQQLGIEMDATKALWLGVRQFNYIAGSYIWRMKSEPEYLLLIISGTIGEKALLSTGESVPVSIYTSGCCLGLSDLLESDLYRYDCIAYEESFCIGIPKSLFFECKKEQPKFSDKLLEISSSIARQQTEKLFISSISGAALKIVASLALYLENNLFWSEKFLQILSVPDEYEIKLSQSEFAKLIGVSRTLFSENCLKLEASNLLNIKYGKISFANINLWLNFIAKIRSPNGVFAKSKFEDLVTLFYCSSI